MIEISNKSNCTSCSACYNACPFEAIEMIEDEEGFKYPKIIKEKCKNCGLCDKVCPMINKVQKNNAEKPKIYAAWSKNEYIRLDSTSGGIFSEFAKEIYKNNGYVCGAIYNKEWLVEHYVSNNIDDLEQLRSSKYLQSDINKTFKEMKNLLEDGQTVLFCGSPCQVSGLNGYLQKDYDNLITIDFICRGMNSPKIFKGYIKDLEKKYRSKVKLVKFKNKTFGWHNFSTRIEFENGKQYIKGRYYDSYMIGYLKYNAFMRPSCYECKFKDLPRQSDFTVADFWGIEKIDEKLDEDKGTSLLLVNSVKGEQLFNKIKENVNFQEVVSDQVFADNVCMKSSPERTPNREYVFRDIDIYSYDELRRKYFPNPGLIDRLKIFSITNKQAIKLRKLIKKG